MIEKERLNTRRKPLTGIFLKGKRIETSRNADIANNVKKVVIIFIQQFS